MQRHQRMRFEDDNFGFSTLSMNNLGSPASTGAGLWIMLIMSLWLPSFINFRKWLLYRWPKSINFCHLRL
jgi:hypothetical protein